MRVLELVPTDGKKSFYGKAYVLEDKETIYLKSYETIVCKIVDGKLFRTWKKDGVKDDFSSTTMRHINAFCDTYGIARINKKDWLLMDVVNA